MADTLESSGNYLPKDLRITSQPDAVDKDKFKVVASGLKINQAYVFQFQYVFEDDTLSQWSPGYTLFTNNELTPTAPTGITVPSTATGAIPVELASFPANARRVDVYIIGGMFGAGKVAYSFTTAGKTTIAADAGSYTVQLITVTPSGVTSTASATYSITISTAGETVQAPTNPNGFSAKKILGGIEVSWDGTYANGTFTGFEAIKIYVGTSASATSGTYKEAGVLSSNNVKNTINIAVDGTYLTYGQTAYIHAAAVNRSGTVGTIQANVASVSGGAGTATSADINDGAVVLAKLASNVLYVDNLKAGTLSSSSYIRSGTKNGARIEISSATSNITTEVDPITGTTSNLTYPVKPGITIYGTNGYTELLRADYNGNLSITGSGSFTGDISGASGTLKNALNIGTYNAGLWGGRGYPFSVDSSGNLEAGSGTIGKWVINSGKFANSTNTYPKIELDPSPIGSNPQIILRNIDSNSESGNAVKLNTTDGIRVGAYNSPNFTVSMDGTMVAKSAEITGKIINTGSSGYGGTLTIDGSYIKQTVGFYIEAPVLQINSSFNAEGYSGYIGVNATGSGNLRFGHSGNYNIDLGASENSLALIINRTGGYDGYTSRGYTLFNLDEAEFRQSSINSAGVASPTVVVGFYGALMNGRAFYYGTRNTSSGINSEVFSSSIGDVYFGTT